MANREINDKKQTIKNFLTLKEIIKNILLVSIVGVILGFLAPFGMVQVATGKTIAYWVIICLVGYFVYSPIIGLTERFTQSVLPRSWHRVAVGALLASVVMSFVVPVVTWLFFDEPRALLAQFSQMFPKTLLIGGIITLITLVKDHLHQQSQALKESEQALESSKQSTRQIVDKAHQDFINQLPVEKRGQLLCLEMSDHYVKVYTDNGHHLILMRFKDAVSALSDFPGMQTHRSWWVAHQAITRVSKDGRKLQLELSNKLSVPVSRTYIDQVKAAGFGA